MKSSILSILFILLLTVAFANKNENKSEVDAEKSSVITLSGQIQDQNSNEALVGVKVTLDGTDKVAYTDFDGNYSFDGVKTGKYNLVASYTSYEKYLANDIQVSLKNNQVDIGLEAAK